MVNDDAEVVTADGKAHRLLDEYDGWVFPEGGGRTALIPARSSPAPTWLTFLGGLASWDQSGGAPDCVCKKPMQHLLDYNGGQFLDGAMHVFVCDQGSCAAEPSFYGGVEF